MSVVDVRANEDMHSSLSFLYYLTKRYLHIQKGLHTHLHTRRKEQKHSFSLLFSSAGA